MDKENLQEMLDAIDKCMKHCGWLHNQNVHSFASKGLEEAEEVREALKNNDYEHVKEEVGDLLWNTLMIIRFLEQEGKANGKEIIDGSIGKMKNRKPFAFEGKTVTEEEAWVHWNKAKGK